MLIIVTKGTQIVMSHRKLNLDWKFNVWASEAFDVVKRSCNVRFTPCRGTTTAKIITLQYCSRFKAYGPML